MSELYNISSSPHIRAKDTSAKIMLYVIIALLPASIFGVYNFGLRALLLIAVCIATCVASEWIFEKIVHKKSTITDFSAVLTGLLLALNLPYTLPIWQAVLGSVFAIVIVKMLFGGLGQNFMNPALGARCFLLVSFASTMTSFTYDGVTGATPLALMRNGESVDTMKMFLGTTAGTIGETSVIALLIGCIILGFGVYCEVLADVAMLPGESFVRAVVQTCEREFGSTKVAFDVTMTVMAALLSFVFAKELNGVREGTIIAALLVGFIARLFGRWFYFVPALLFPETDASLSTTDNI